MILSYSFSKIWDNATVQVDGEEAPHFLAGLAENIGLEDIRASNIVSASVAARVRSLFLQAWVRETVILSVCMQFFLFYQL